MRSLPRPPPTTPTAEVLARISAVAWTLEPLAPHERAGLLRDEAAVLLDGLLVRIARGRGALEVAIAEGLAALAVGDRVLRLGYSGLGDYARERLDMAPGTARNQVRLAHGLRERPVLAAAVRRGDVTARQAEILLPVARGADEAAWVERASRETVRGLAAAVRAAGLGDVEPDEPWDRLALEIPPDGRPVVDAALELAGVVLGASTPVWRRLEAICAEYLGEHPSDPAPDQAAARSRPRSFLEPDLEALKEGLEHEFRRWEALGEPERFAAPTAPCAGDLAPDPLAVDARLRELAAMRAAWDTVVGHLAMLVQNTGVWRDMGFASLGHYAEERLGMSGRAIEQRAALERKLWWFPGLRAAVREGRLSYEKARIVAANARGAGTDVDALVARAEQLTCIALRRELDSAGRAQMCGSGEASFPLPRSVAILFDAAAAAAREASGRWLTPGEALAVLAAHFLATWKHALAPPRTPAQRALARDGGLCQVPGCSRAADHGHHLTFRSRGGGDELSNLGGACAAHHLHGIHGGWIRVRGTAPGGLVWELPAPPAPLLQGSPAMA